MNEQEEKWKEEAREIVHNFYLSSLEQDAFIKGYLAACRKGQVETDQKEVERGQFSKELIQEKMKVVGLKKEIERLGLRKKLGTASHW